MHSFEFILIMLVMVLASSFIGARFPSISTPLVQIVIGVVLTLLPISFEMHLEPDLFMVLFIAPILFDDAKRMDKPTLWRLKFPVLWLALGLVFLTVLVLGFVVHLFTPSIPLAAAFALAAALAPTDAVSVDSIKKNATISGSQSKLLQGESLLNDASAIVSFRFAVAAAITGIFSVWEAEGVFTFMFLGGLALGVIIILLRYVLLYFLRTRGIDSASFYVLFEIVTPFLVFLLAELLGVSGIIAVVAAGIAHGIAPRMVTPTSARLAVVSSSVWSVLSFTLNGLVFLILGTQLPYVTERVWIGTMDDALYLVFFVFLILFVILALRYIWILIMRRNVNLGHGEVQFAYVEEPVAPFDNGDEEVLSIRFREMSAEEREAAFERDMAFRRQQYQETRGKRREAKREARKAEKHAARSDKNYWKLHLYDSLLLTLSGVKGAITLAIILSIPMTKGGSLPFPERDLLILLASGVIVLSLLIATFVIPLIAPRKRQAHHSASDVNAIIDIYRKVIDGMSTDTEPDEIAAANEVIRQYYLRISTLVSNNSLEFPHESNVRRYIIELQLEHVEQLIDEDKVDALTAMLYTNSLSRQLARVEHHNVLLWEARAFVQQITHRLRARRHARQEQVRKKAYDRHVMRFDLHVLQLDSYRYAIETLRTHESTEELPERTVDLLLVELEQRLRRLEARWGSEGTQARGLGGREERRIRVEARALELERLAIHDALEEGEISSETAKMLRDSVTMMELDIEDQLE